MTDLFGNILIMILSVVVLIGGGYLMLVILGLCVFACQKAEKAAETSAEGTPGVQFQTIGLEEAVTLAKEQNKLILVDFFSPG